MIGFDIVEYDIFGTDAVLIWASVDAVRGGPDTAPAVALGTDAWTTVGVSVLGGEVRFADVDGIKVIDASVGADVPSFNVAAFLEISGVDGDADCV